MGRTPGKFRPEIQGLRGLAALLVAIYHIWFARVSGGVDVFFVVSGFLITHSLLNRLEADGRIRPVHFLWDLFCRLGPAAMLVIAATAVGARLFLPHADWPFNIGEAIAAAFFVNNWHLAFSAVDYLNRTGDPRPFQHFWALSVQWQFYLLWSVLLLVVHRFAVSRFRQVLAASIVALLVVSFLVAIVQTAHNQPFAYFNTAARIWEFAAGALLAMFLPGERPLTGARLSLGWLGLAAIMACGAVLPVSTSFPGFAALVPVVGAMLVLSYGSGGHPASVRRVLASAPLLAMGRVSYYFYLWHWPIVVLWLSYSLQPQASFADGLAILLIALLLSVATHAFMRGLEKLPLRAAPGFAAFAAAAAALVFCLVWRAEVQHAKSVQMAMPMPPSVTHPGAVAAGKEVARQPLFPGAFRVRNEFPSPYKEGCSQDTLGTDVVVCAYGDVSAHFTVAAIGNSHITDWLPALDLVGRELGWRILLITKNDCRLHVHPSGLADDAARSCDLWNERLPRIVRRLEPDFLFVAATVRQAGREVFPGEFPEAWRRLVDDMSRVVAMRSTPRFPFDIPDCVDLHGAESPRCRSPRSSALGASDAGLRGDVERTGAAFLDLTRYFCDAIECFPVAGNIVIYRDHDHLTPAYVSTMKMPLAESLRALIRAHAQPPPASRSARAATTRQS